MNIESIYDQIEIISLSNTPWHSSYWMSRQFLCYALSKYVKVKYAINRPQLNNTLNLNYLYKNILRSNGSVLHKPRNLNISNCHILFPKIYRYKIMDRLSCWCYAKSISFSSRNSIKKRILYVWDPVDIELIKKIKSECIIYHPYDKFDKFSANTTISANEEKLLRLAHAVITPHRRIADSLSHNNIHIVHNATLIDEFKNTQLVYPITSLTQLPRPRIGYIGSINQKIDYKLLYKLFLKNKCWQLVMIGNINKNKLLSCSYYHKLRKLNNVHFYSAVPFNEVYVNMLELNIGIMPYDLTTWAGYCESPLKLYQYWATGLPVVSTMLPNLAHKPGILSIGTSTSSFEDLINWELENNSEKYKQNRYKLADKNSWDKRAKDVLNIILSTL